MAGAAALWVRTDWRHRSRALVVLALIAGVAGAGVLTAVAGARRTASSLERLTEATRTADVIVDVGAVDPQIVDEITALSMIELSGAYTVVFAVVDGVESDLAIWAPRDDRIGVQIESDRVIRGRVPNPSAVDEVAVSETAAEVAGVDVGDEISVATMTPEQVAAEQYFPARGPELRLEIVGVVRGLDDVAGTSDGGFIASQAFLDTVRGRVDEWTTYLAVDLVDGATVADFETELSDRIPPDQEYGTIPLSVRSDAARGTVSVIGSGLTVFAIVAAIAAAVVVGQAVGRHIGGARHDDETLRTLGFSRRARRVSLVVLALPAAVGAAALAAVGSWLASPIMPIGLARRIDPDLGQTADWTVLAAGAIAIVGVVLVSAAIAATSLTRSSRSARAQPGPSPLTAAVARAGPVAANGVRLALDRRTPALPIRSAIVGLTVAVLGTVSVLMFSASLDRLLGAPDRWGYAWDLLLNFTSDDVDAAAERIAGDDRLTAVARWDVGFSHVEDDPMRAYGLTPLAGDLGFALRSGRQPVSPSEVVLGPETADRLGVGIGERVRVAPEPGRTDGASVIVVGTALFPDTDGEGSFSNAVGYFGPAFTEHAIVPDLFEASQLVVRVAPGLDVDAVAAGLNDDYPGSAASGEILPRPPGEVANLSDVRSLPRWLAAFVALLGIASLGHVLLTTLWRRRAELATLRSLGFTPNQTLSCLVWQALTIALVSLLIGVPLGLVVGRAAWFAVTDPIGVATDPSRPLLIIGAAALGALVVATLVALGPGWRAARLRPAEALRAE